MNDYASLLRAAIVAALLPYGSLPASAQTTPNYTGIYWVPSESGWGLNVVHQGDVLFPAWYTYDLDGRVLWFIVSGAQRQTDGSYRGPIARFTGRPFDQINGQSASLGGQEVGSATLRFLSGNQVDFSYTIGNQTQTKRLQPFVFGAAAPNCTFVTGSRRNAGNYTDIWWNPNESGWGLTLAHQGNVIFAAWYTYDRQNRPMWLVAVAERQADGSYRGDLGRAQSGTPYPQINGSNATSQPLPRVGDLRLRFSDGETGTLEYELDGVRQTKSITRFAFANPLSVCSDGAPGGGGGADTECVREPRIGDQRVFQGESRVGNLPATTFSESQRVVGDGTFDGIPVRIVETYDAQGRRQSRDYFRLTATTIDSVAAESFDPATGTLRATVRYAPPLAAPRQLAVGSSVTLNYTLQCTGSGCTDQGPRSSTIQALPKESVTVPLGTFNACKWEIRSFASGTLLDTTQQYMTGERGVLKLESRTPTPIGEARTERKLSAFTPGS